MNCPDYFPDKTDGKSGYRIMKPVAFDATNLRDVRNQQHESYKNMLLMSRISMSQVERYTLLMRTSGWFWEMLKLISRYWFDIPWRFRTSLDPKMTEGQALVGSLRAAILKKDIPLSLPTSFKLLVAKDSHA